MKLLYFVLAFEVLTFSTSPARASEPQPSINSPALQVKNLTQLRQIIPAKAGSLRKSFYVILNAKKAGLAQYAALQYRELWQKHPGDSKLKAEYAFSHANAMIVSPLDNLSREQKSLQSILKQNLAEADTCRAESLAALPNVPEVLIMAAQGYSERHPAAESIALSEKAVSLDPKWFIAHYWLGSSLVTLYVPNTMKGKSSGLVRALAEFKKAETLEPSVKNGSIMNGYIHAYNGLKQYDKALLCINRRLEKVAGKPDRKGERVVLLKLKRAAEANLKVSVSQPAVSPRR